MSTATRSPSEKFRLPDGWALPEVVEDVIVADGITLHRAGLSTAKPGGDEVLGAAADTSGPTSARAWYELLERVSGLEASERVDSAYELKDRSGRTLATVSRAEAFPESDAPERWRYARSNGIAVHGDWRSACERAQWELAERDRVLRSWYGEILPRRVALAAPAFERTTCYEWLAYSFEEPDPASFSASTHVVGVFGFPLADDAPFVLGFAGRSTEAEATAAAGSEALQQLAFLWGEPLPAEPPAQGPGQGPGPMLHLDTYQVRGADRRIRGWLEGGHAQFHDGRPPPGGRRDVGFIDLTPSWLPAGLRVVKAISSGATPLVFGDSPFASHLPHDLRLHPIP